MPLCGLVDRCWFQIIFLLLSSEYPSRFVLKIFTYLWLHIPLESFYTHCKKRICLSCDRVYEYLDEHTYQFFKLMVYNLRT